MEKSKKFNLPVLAIDLGGTKIATAIISDNGRLIAKENHPTQANEGPQSVINRLLAAIEHILSRHGMEAVQLHGISVAAAGGVDLARGVLTISPNLPDWQDVPLRAIVQERFGVDTFLVNDAQAAALGEHRFGAGKEVKNLILITIGTGIGGGIIINGELYSGACGSAGEIGHMTIDVNGPRCGCGKFGCWETLASGTAIARETKRRIGCGERSSLVEMVKGEVENITAKEVETAARGGDSLALDVIAQAANYLGVGMVNLANIFNPEMFIIGGGMAKWGELLLGPVRQAVKEKAFPTAQCVRIVIAQLGEDAGLFGAAAFAFRQKVK